MKIGVENLTFAQHGSFHGLRLLHLHDHLGLGKNLRRRFDHCGASSSVVSIRGANAAAGIFLHPDLVAVANRLAHGNWRHADAVFMVFNFLGYTDEHCHSSS